ncbi:VHS domain-containing protein [Dorcoceras hygrometricum]|nr:VHS domain-containing protein [Dorcoceras hygrometricum]
MVLSNLSLLFKGNIVVFRFDKISDLGDLSFRGNERSELISAESTEFVKSGYTQMSLGSHNFCKDIVAVSTVIIAVDASDFVGVFRRGTDVHMILSESSSFSSESAHIDPAVFAGISQRPMDTDLTSPHPSSTDSHVFFTTDDTTMEIRNDSEKFKDMILMEIRSLEKKFTEMLVQQDNLYGGLFNNMRQEIQIQKSALSLDILASQRKLIIQQAALATVLDDIRKDVDETKAALSNALLEFHAQAQENYNNLSSQLGEIVAYINRGNDKKGEERSSHRPQPPPDDQNRPSGGSASRGGGSGRRDDRRVSSTKRGSSSGGGGSSTAGGPYKKNVEWWLYGKNQF